MGSGTAVLSDSSRMGSVELYTTGQGSAIRAATRPTKPVAIVEPWIELAKSEAVIQESLGRSPRNFAPTTASAESAVQPVAWKNIKSFSVCHAPSGLKTRFILVPRATP
jgi:hypothetical protein